MIRSSPRVAGRHAMGHQGPQPVVQQLVALGAIRGEVLDRAPGRHHALRRQGYAATGIDRSSARPSSRFRTTRVRRGVSELPGWRRHHLRVSWTRAGFILRKSSIAPSTPSAPRSSCKTCAGAAPGQQTGCTAVHVRIRRGTSVNGFSMPRSLSGDDFSPGASGRRLGDHLPGDDHLPGQLERQALGLMAARNRYGRSSAVRAGAVSGDKPWLVRRPRTCAPFWEATRSGLTFTETDVLQ